MRIVKLSTDQFDPESELHEYFRERLLDREPPGMFMFTRGRIGWDGVRPGEALVFTYKARIRYVADAKTGPKPNADEEDADEFPMYLVIDMATVRSTDLPLHRFETALAREGVYTKNLVHTQAWVPIEDDERAREILDGLLRVRRAGG